MIGNLETKVVSSRPYANVVSLRTGLPFVLPTYRDYRGGILSFQAFTASGRVTVQATKAVLGLVLHRSVSLPGSPATWVRWALSEPRSGYRVVAGATRRDVMDSLAMLVAYFGGEPEFLQWIESSSLAAKMTGIRGNEAIPAGQ